MGNKDKLIAFDVDGVLEGYGGTIGGAIIDTYRSEWVIGIISARADHTVIKDEFNLDFSYLYNGNAFTKAKSDYPNMKRYVYVSDNSERELVAKEAGFEFIYPEKLGPYVSKDVINMLVGFQVNSLKLALAVIFYIFNVLDYYTTKRGLEAGLKEGNPFARAIMRMGWKKYQAVKFIGPALFAFQALTSEDPYYIWAACLGVGASMFAYAAIQNMLLIAGRKATEKH